MKIGRTPAILLASTLSIIALVIIQFNWIQHSKRLMEDAFDNRVCTALCSTVEGFYGVPSCADSSACKVNSNIFNQPTCAINSQKDRDSALLGSMAHALEFYDIDQNYSISFTGKKIDKNEEPNTYQFPVQNENSESAFVNVAFPEKNRYFLGESRFILVSSIAVLIFIGLVFFFANLMLWRQKRQSEINIDFFNNTAHEFRTPLTNILLASKMISRQNQLPDDNKYLQIIRRESAKLLDQSEKVLHLAKLENGEYQLQKEFISLKEIVHGVLSDMDIQIQNNQAAVKTDDLPDDLEIFGDKLHVSNVFRNLLENAIKYNDNKPEISISAEQSSKGVTIIFKDNGIGIPKSEQKIIFDKFQRLGEGNTHNRKGFGLGLTYVKLIMGLHKGFIKVMSNKNEGSQFALFLPTPQR
ncbi:MAG: sensor histidine kinase [Bacteroidetes bacterium]|nr:MAG: sensor histidine kinase [Bacteroidota bacterium]